MEEQQIFNPYCQNELSAEAAKTLYFAGQKEMLTAIYDCIRNETNKGNRFLHLNENFNLGFEIIDHLRNLGYNVEEIFRDNSMERHKIQTVSIYW